MIYNLLKESFNILIFLCFGWTLFSIGLSIIIIYKSLQDAKRDFNGEFNKATESDQVTENKNTNKE